MEPDSFTDVDLSLFSTQDNAIGRRGDITPLSTIGTYGRTKTRAFSVAFDICHVFIQCTVLSYNKWVSILSTVSECAVREIMKITLFAQRIHRDKYRTTTDVSHT